MADWKALGKISESMSSEIDGLFNKREEFDTIVNEFSEVKKEAEKAEQCCVEFAKIYEKLHNVFLESTPGFEGAKYMPRKIGESGHWRHMKGHLDTRNFSQRISKKLREEIEKFEKKYNKEVKMHGFENIKAFKENLEAELKNAWKNYEEKLNRFEEGLKSFESHPERNKWMDACKNSKNEILKKLFYCGTVLDYNIGRNIQKCNGHIKEIEEWWKLFNEGKAEENKSEKVEEIKKKNNTITNTFHDNLRKLMANIRLLDETFKKAKQLLG